MLAVLPHHSTMPAMKRPAGARSDPIKNRCKLIKDAIEAAEGCPERTQNMLCSTINVTVGALKTNRHPFNARFVEMIGEVLAADHARLMKEVDTKEGSFASLTPAKAVRESALAQATAHAEAATEALETSKRAVADIGAQLKDANAALREAAKAQRSGDEDLEVQDLKKQSLEGVQKDSLAPLLDGSATGEEKATKLKAVLDVGRAFKFDASLLSTAEPVLQKEVADRGSFDATCLEQLQAGFASAIASIGQQLTTGAPGKAERAAAVEQAEAAKQAAETSQAELKEKFAAAKDAKAAADAADRAASQSVHDFMPDMKMAGDALDEAKEELKEFTEGALQAFNELKDLKEGDFKDEKDEVHTGSSYYETIDGLRCDRGIVDACRTAVTGSDDGRVQVEDAKKVFEHVADGNKETACERWTVRYCLQEFKWTEAAHDWLVEELKKVPQVESPAKKARTSGGGYYEKIDGFQCDRAIIDTCREAVDEVGEAVGVFGRVSEEDARKVWAKAADGNEVTDAEKWTIRYCLSNFTWSRGAHDWILEQLQKA